MARPNVKIIPKTYPTMDGDQVIRGEVVFSQINGGTTQQFVIGRIGGGQSILACKLQTIAPATGFATLTAALGTIPILTTGVRTFTATMIAATDVTAAAAVLTLAAAGAGLDTSGAAANNPTGEYDVVIQTVAGAGTGTAGRIRAWVDVVSFPGPGGGGVPPYSQ